MFKIYWKNYFNIKNRSVSPKLINLPYCNLFDKRKYKKNDEIHYPNFLQKRLNYFYSDCIDPRKNKKYLVIGNQSKPSSIILSGNDYLSIAHHSKIINSQIRDVSEHGSGVMMSAIFVQENTSEKILEKKFGNYLGFENSILCQSGWAANVGLIQAIADETIPVYIDFMTHMSLWEGIKSAGAKAISFRHNDIIHLEKLIKQHGAGIIAVDSVYSTNGSICPLKELIEVGNKYDCVLVIDESHSLGTHGPNGSGIIAQLGLSNQVHFITASLAKAFVNRAGVVACSNRFAGYFPYVSRPAIFSSALLPSDIGGIRAAIEVISEADDLRQKLHYNADYLRSGLDALGYNVSNSQSQIIVLESGTEEQTEILRDALEARDIFGAVFCRPATPKNRSIIRFSINASLNQEKLDYILKVCDEIRDEVGMREWRSTKRKNTFLFKNSDS